MSKMYSIDLTDGMSEWMNDRYLQQWSLKKYHGQRKAKQQTLFNCVV